MPELKRPTLGHTGGLPSPAGFEPPFSVGFRLRSVTGFGKALGFFGLVQPTGGEFSVSFGDGSVGTLRLLKALKNVFHFLDLVVPLERFPSPHNRRFARQKSIAREFILQTDNARTKRKRSSPVGRAGDVVG